MCYVRSLIQTRNALRRSQTENVRTVSRTPIVTRILFVFILAKMIFMCGQIAVAIELEQKGREKRERETRALRWDGDTPLG